MSHSPKLKKSRTVTPLAVGSRPRHLHRYTSLARRRRGGAAERLLRPCDTPTGYGTRAVRVPRRSEASNDPSIVDGLRSQTRRATVLSNAGREHTPAAYDLERCLASERGTRPRVVSLTNGNQSHPIIRLDPTYRR